MKNNIKLPVWQEILNNKLIQRSFGSAELQTLINKAQKDYLPWDILNIKKCQLILNQRKRGLF